MIATETPAPSPEPRNRSSGALVLFLLIALLMPVCLLVYHMILWSAEQTAIASGSQAYLEWSGLIGLAVQGMITTVVIGGAVALDHGYTVQIGICRLAERGADRLSCPGAAIAGTQ